MHSRRPGPPTADHALDERGERELADFREALAHARSHAAGEVEGLLGPTSVAWQMWREPTILAAGLPAVLLQIAHPAIAEGVSAYSMFDKDLVGRTRRTFTSLYEFTFGSLHEATLASQRLHSIHRRVAGVVDDTTLRAHGSAYRANDQPLLLWVGATLPVMAQRVFEQTVRPLDEMERERAHREWATTSAATGVLPKHLPATARDFDRWFESMIANGTLEVGQKAKRIAHRLFNTAVTRGPFDEALAAGLLPPAIRDAYGLPWNRTQQRMYNAVIATLRTHVRVVPAPYRYVVAWHQATLRVARARGQQESKYSRMLNALDRRIDLPTSLKPIAPSEPTPRQTS